MLNSGIYSLNHFCLFLRPHDKLYYGMCRVHKPGVPRGPASTPGLGPRRQHVAHGPAQESKRNRPEGRSGHRPEGLSEEQHPLVNYFGPPLRPERSLQTPAASGRPLRSEGLAQRSTFGFDPASPTEGHRNPAHRSSPTGATKADWGHPTGDARSEGARDERRKQARARKPNHDTRDHTLYAFTNSTLQPP